MSLEALVGKSAIKITVCGFFLHEGNDRIIWENFKLAIFACLEGRESQNML